MIDQIRRALETRQPQRIHRDGVPRAAILIPIYDVDGVPHVLLTVRTEEVEYHKGQISFPGGAQDAEDAGLATTALREAEEEIGLKQEDVEIWGRLDDMVTITDFLVSPFVGGVTKPAPYPFAPSAIEVAELLVVPLPHLRDPSSLNTEPKEWRGYPARPPSYNFGGHLIWGATARFLHQFLEVTSVE
jgi:8-oxo-dGTP pyrophosphatase MutT (NUDIX family)